MSRTRSTFALALLLLIAQQGAVLHELGHIYRTGTPELQNKPVLIGKICETCLAFAQVTNPASGTIWVPPLDEARLTLSLEPQYSVIAADVPAPRSRGLPTLL